MIDLIATLHSTAVTSTVINNNEVSLAIIQHKVDFFTGKHVFIRMVSPKPTSLLYSN